MMSAWQVGSVFRLAGFWKSSETLTRTHRGLFIHVPSLNTRTADLTRSLFMCSRSFPSPQSPALPSNSGRQARGSFVASNILTPKMSCVSITRGKFRKSGRKNITQKQDDEVDTDDDDEDDGLELESGTDFRELKARVSSLRIDAILKAGLNMSKNKVESAFYDSRIRINGKKLLKKSHQCHVGDEVDVIKTVSTDNPKNLYVARVLVVTLGQVDENSDKVTVKLRRYPNLLVEAYKDYKVPQLDE